MSHSLSNFSKLEISLSKVYKNCAIIFLGLLFFTVRLSAQEVKPQGAFVGDSVKIGMKIPYSLSIQYPTRMDVVFPDSLYDYSPFELEGKQYFATRSDSTNSYDSAVYYLSTFEIDSIQYLQLPVFFVNSSDSIPIYADRDSVILVELIPLLPDSIQFIENTTYFNVATEFNYPYLLLALGILLVIVIIVLIVFGGKIKKFYKMRRLKKRHRKFLENYDQLTNKINAESDLPDIERAAFVWKRYIERLEKLPISKLTTKEITAVLEPSDQVLEALKEVDKTLYSKKKDQSLTNAYSALRNEAINRFENNIASIKQNG